MVTIREKQRDVGKVCPLEGSCKMLNRVVWEGFPGREAFQQDWSVLKDAEAWAIVTHRVAFLP